ETVHQQRKAAVAARIAHISHPHHGVLHMGGNDFEVLGIKRQQLEIDHGWSALFQRAYDPIWSSPSRSTSLSAEGQCGRIEKTCQSAACVRFSSDDGETLSRY